MPDEDTSCHPPPELTNDREVVVVATTYPPVGGGHAERTVGYVKHWCRRGLRLRVITVTLEEAATYPQDYDRFNDVAGVQAVYRLESFRESLRRRTWLPSGLRGAAFSAANLLMVPDAHRGWAIRSARLIRKLYAGKTTPVVYTTSAPYSVHCAGLYLKRHWPGVRWIADFRDAYTTNYRVPRGVKMPLIGAVHRRTEQAIYDRADGVVINTDENLRQIKSRFRIDERRFHVVPNGYDPDFRVPPSPPQRDGPLRLMYVGGLRGDWFEGDFYRALARMRDRHPAAFANLRVDLVGADAPLGELAALPGLDSVLKARGFLPRDRLPEIMQEADAFLLLLPISDVHRGCVPQKLYTYFVSDCPVLAVIPEGQAAEFMRRARVGLIRSPDDPDGIADALAEMVGLKHDGRLAKMRDNQDTAFIHGLSKSVLGDRLIEILLPSASGTNGQ